MKGSKTIITRAIFLIPVFAAFALTVTAQQLSLGRAGESSAAAAVSRGGRVDTAQDGALSKLTDKDIQMLVKEDGKHNPSALNKLAADPNERKKILDNLKLNLSLASEAHKTGFANKESIKMQLELARLEILATAYNDRLKKNAGQENAPAPPFGNLADEDVNKFFNAPANKAKYDAELKKFVAFVAESQKSAGLPEDNSAEQRDFITSQWKKAVYGAAKAKELGLENKAITLVYEVQQALILARNFAQDVADKNKPTQAELDAYAKENPKFDKKTYIARAENILQKVKAGEDFASLANQFSEDPGNKDAETGKPQGGIYDWADRDRYVKEFSDAAWALKEGETSGLVETQFGYHIIKLEGKRVQPGRDGKDEEQIKVRHILVYTMVDDEADPQARPLSLENALNKKVSDKKEKKVLDDILARNPIDLPADFTVIIPETAAVKPAVKKPAAKKPVKHTSARRKRASTRHRAVKKTH